MSSGTSLGQLNQNKRKLVAAFLQHEAFFFSFSFQFACRRVFFFALGARRWETTLGVVEGAPSLFNFCSRSLSLFFFFAINWLANNRPEEQAQTRLVPCLHRLLLLLLKSRCMPVALPFIRFAQRDR